MPQYLVAGYLPDDFDPSQADEAMGREIHVLNKEMIAAGVRRFACGLGGREVAANADWWRSSHHRRAVPRDQGAHRGVWILECADMDAALAWARKGVTATRGQVEVREIFFNPAAD